MAQITTLKAGSAELNRTLDGVRSGVEAMSSRNITESEFKETLLQLALAFHSGVDNLDLGHWVARTGSVYNGVVVVDDNTGMPIFHTPGIFTAINLEISSGLHEIISEAGFNQSVNLPTDRIYREGLDKGSRISMDNGARHILGWYEIFGRYGYKMTVVEDEEASPEVEQEIVKQTQPPVQDWGDGDLA